MRSLAAASFLSVLLAAIAQALRITTPTKDQQALDLRSTSFTVQWERVETDPLTAHLFLSNQASGSTPYSQDLGEIDLTKSSFTVEPNQDIPVQSGYTFNIQATVGSTGILAQSSQFNVTSSGSDGSTSPNPPSPPNKPAASAINSALARAPSSPAGSSGVGSDDQHNNSSSGATNYTSSGTPNVPPKNATTNSVTVAGAAPPLKLAYGMLLSLSLWLAAVVIA